MATTFQASTPPPPSSLHTPTTPRLGGFHDDYQPYTPRKSSRLSQRARAMHTPPPRAAADHLRAESKKSATMNTDDVEMGPNSPQTASKKRNPRISGAMSGRRVSGALNAESTSLAAEALGLAQPKIQHHRSATVLRQNGMLPTPDKTPKKAPTEVAPAITSIARNLFQIRSETAEEAMPKRSRRKNAYTLDSFEAETDAAPIAIYTDSHERVPEVDNGADNPFYGQGSVTTPEPVKKPTSKRTIIAVPGEDDQMLGKVQDRTDGLVYVFRGKKIFRKFDDEHLVESDSEDDQEAFGLSLPSRSRGPITRSSIKPRLLFASASRPKASAAHNTEDEEADTDIEESSMGASYAGQFDDMGVTPTTRRIAPASPPSTSRVTRTMKHTMDVDMISSPAMAEDEPRTPKRRSTRGARGGSVSPYSDWPRQKDSPATRLRKRYGTALTSGEDKKARR